MAIFDLYSKREKRLRGEFSDIYTYDQIPKALRNQIVHIIRDAVGDHKGGPLMRDLPEELYENNFDILCREYGRFSLTGDSKQSKKGQVLSFFLQTDNVEETLDVIELFFVDIDDYIRKNFNRYASLSTVRLSPDEAISDLNERFKENGIGYSFESGRIIRIDSSYIHAEVAKPTLSLLHSDKFKGANEEYLKAHEHYRHGRNKECLTECLKAFESVMKSICIEKGWIFDQKDTAKKLIQICFDNGLIPTYVQGQFTSLKSLLESGIPTLRNKLGGHGQGQIPQKVGDEITRYGLNLTGTNIVFMIEQSGIK